MAFLALIKQEAIMKKIQKNYPFIDLTNDRNFKLFFSRNKEVLLSLLKTFLPLPEKKSIQDVEIISDKKAEDTQSTVTKQGERETSSFQKQSLTLKDSTLYPFSIGGKQSILDLNIQLNTGEKIDVEMQATNQPHFSKRVVFYWARLHAMGLNMSEDYGQLHPTYSLVFTTFPVLEEEKERQLITPFSIRSDRHPHSVLNSQLQMMFVDLGCFNKDIKQALDKKDQWCYFIKNAGRISHEEFKLLSTKGEDMAKAVGLFDNVSARDLEWLRKRTEERAHWDKISMQAEARRKGHAEGMEKGHAEGMEKGHAEGMEKGHAEGMEKGHAEGMEKGHAEGMEKGMEKEKKAIALNMLKSCLDTSLICKITGLTVEEINKLKNIS